MSFITKLTGMLALKVEDLIVAGRYAEAAQVASAAARCLKAAEQARYNDVIQEVMKGALSQLAELAELARRDTDAVDREVENEMNAAQFAIERHAGQMYGDRPYVTHLCAVWQVLRDSGVRAGPLQTAAWLHDVLEDTPTTFAELGERFGEEVQALVWAVTGVGANRKERNGEVYRKIKICPAAADLKLADRIANVEAAIRDGAAGKFDMYREEHDEFEAALYGLGSPHLWARLREAITAS